MISFSIVNFCSPKYKIVKKGMIAYFSVGCTSSLNLIKLNESPTETLEKPNLSQTRVTVETDTGIPRKFISQLDYLGSQEINVLVCSTLVYLFWDLSVFLNKQLYSVLNHKVNYIKPYRYYNHHRQHDML